MIGLLDKQNWLTDKSENKTCLVSNDKIIASVHVNILIVWWVRAKIFYLPFHFIALRTFCLLTSRSNLNKNNHWLFDRVSVRQVYILYFVVGTAVKVSHILIRVLGAKVNNVMSRGLWLTCHCLARATNYWLLITYYALFCFSGVYAVLTIYQLYSGGQLF